jgi:hypothetical protein
MYSNYAFRQFEICIWIFVFEASESVRQLQHSKHVNLSNTPSGTRSLLFIVFSLAFLCPLLQCGSGKQDALSGETLTFFTSLCVCLVVANLCCSCRLCLLCLSSLFIVILNLHCGCALSLGSMWQRQAGRTEWCDPHLHGAPLCAGTQRHPDPTYQVRPMCMYTCIYAYIRQK